MINRFKPFSTMFKPFIIMLAQCLSSHLHFLLFKFYVFQLPAWWAEWLLWLLLTKCSNVLAHIYKAFLLLFHCCIILEIKLTTTATATATTSIATTTTTTTNTTTTTITTTTSTTFTTSTIATTMYTIKDADTTPVMFRLMLHLHPVC